LLAAAAADSVTEQLTDNVHVADAVKAAILIFKAAMVIKPAVVHVQLQNVQTPIATHPQFLRADHF